MGRTSNLKKTCVTYLERSPPLWNRWRNKNLWVTGYFMLTWKRPLLDLVIVLSYCYCYSWVKSENSCPHTTFALVSCDCLLAVNVIVWLPLLLLSATWPYYQAYGIKALNLVCHIPLLVFLANSLLQLLWVRSGLPDVTCWFIVQLPFKLPNQCNQSAEHNRTFVNIAYSSNCLQCFDAVGWAAGRASGL